MGKKKLPFEYIERNIDRSKCYNTRTKGLIKKAIELSVLCDLEIGIIINN